VGHLNQIVDAFRRSSFSTVTVRMKIPDDLMLSPRFETTTVCTLPKGEEVFEEQSR
jgi:hypothetical protein